MSEDMKHGSETFFIEGEGLLTTAGRTVRGPTRSRTFPSTFGGAASIPDGDLRRNLAFRNLTRANMVRLASGQQLNRGRLRGVGARIVAETFHRAMQGSRFSIVREPDWRPNVGRDATTFEMTDLLFFAFGGPSSTRSVAGRPALTWLPLPTETAAR